MKKKTSLYFIVPLVCVLGFAGYYTTFLKGYNQKEANRVAKIAEDKKRKGEELIANQNKAYEDALSIRQKKDAEKQKKDADVAAEKEAKIKRKETRTKAEQDAERLLRTIDDKNSEAKVITAEVTELERQKHSIASEVDLIREAAKLAQENAKQAQAQVLQYQKASLARQELARQAAIAAEAAKKK